MSEWWTYRPEDFLMFAPRTYWRRFELHNQAWWPAQVLAVVAGLAIAVGLWRGKPGTLRFAATVLALSCAFVAWAFLWQRYAAINWAAEGLAWAFGALASGLLVLSTRSSLALTTGRVRLRVGLGLLLWAVFVHPLLALATGRPWVQAEVLGLAPDPTAIATLGVLLCADAGTRATRVLLGMLRGGALAWCAVSAATLATMGSAQGWVMLGAVLVAAAGLGFGRARD
ncbi:MAG: MFS transporter permease [Burkholderiales bacterium]|nr:MAG: MFS transporter permease [Burkholderiales bacterium]